MEPIGIYIHIPYCGKKCPYCDFYSTPPTKSARNQYADTMTERLLAYKDRRITADTLYFGGGTPNLLGGEQLSRLIHTARESFVLPDTSEITVEANPFSATPDFFRQIHDAGANRLSLGLQSANPDELRFLGRKHTPEQAATVIQNAKAAGFANLSLDLMLGIPGQTRESLLRSIDFCESMNVQHISAYLLKIEPGTAFFTQKEQLPLPDEEAVSELYLTAVAELAKRGFAQYEISNFAKNGFTGRHNLKYWHCMEYLGFGPSAHSFWEGKRFYYPRSTEAFLQGEPPIPDGDGGSRAEFAMLQLRLTEGLSHTIWQSRFGEPLPAALLRTARRYEKPGLLAFDSPDHFHLTPNGFLVSNLLIGELLAHLE